MNSIRKPPAVEKLALTVEETIESKPAESTE